MARKQKQPQVPTQFKHLRFAEAETGDILNFGGFSLAYRCIQQPSDVAGRPNIHVEYAYSECSINDNFNKRDGRNRTYNRLANKAPDYYELFDLTPQLPEGYEHHIIDLKDGIVDVSHSIFDVPRAVVEQFLTTFSGVLNVGTEEEGEGNLLQNIFVTENGILAIDAEVLTYSEPAFEAVANEVANTVVRIADETIDMIDGIENTATAEQLAEIRKSISDIKDLCSTMAAASSDEDEDEEEEGDDDGEEDSEEEIEGDEEGDDDADELDTEADDGGTDDEESDDADEEDDEEEIEGDDEEDGGEPVEGDTPR
jgi:hypothetical protein